MSSTQYFVGLTIVYYDPNPESLSSWRMCTENQILKTVAMKNSIHYSKQNTANAIRVASALASLHFLWYLLI